MKQFVLASLMALISITAFAQTGSVKGRVLDASGEGAVGANVILKGSAGVGATANLDGTFMINNVPAGAQTFVITSIGLLEQEVNVTVTAGQTADLGTIRMEESVIGLQEVQVIASVAIDRKTPVAVSSIRGSIIETKLGNQEFPEILRSTPGIYTTKQGGGFGDARINVRGFNQRNVAVMINGIPVNDMENGWVYWSNWAGLSDVTSNMQVQRGLGATKLAVSAVGGSINIITDAAKMEQGGSVSVGVGNNGYQKYGVSYSTGLMDNGLALTVQGTRTAGDGYVQGTQFSAWSYFASLSQQLGENHTIAVTALGAPQWHHQRSWANPLSDYAAYTTGPKADVRTYPGIENGDQFNIRYNSDFGYLNGEEFAMRRNFYHKPKVFVNHYWTVNSDWEVATSAYYSAGRGGGTGDLGRINNIRPFFSVMDDANGHLRFDDIVAWNSGQTVADFGADIPTWDAAAEGFGAAYNGQRVGESFQNGIIRRASMNEHNWYGVISNVTGKLSDNLSLSTGIDLRSYRGLHYRRVENLLGLQAYHDDDDINNREKFITAEGRADGNEIDYNNDGLVQWYSAYGQLEYSNDQLTAFISGSGALQRFQRIDYFLYEDTDPEQTSPWVNHWGGTVKGGLNYNINENHNVYVNGGYFSQQPIFDNVFINFSNDVDSTIENRTVNAIELGYGFRSGMLSVNLNAYRTVWENRTLELFIRDYTPGIDGTARFTNLGQQHQGIEMDLSFNPIPMLTINGMLSLGDWTYSNDFEATIFNADNQGEVIGQETLYIDAVKVGDAAQTTANIEAIFRPIKGLNIYGSWYYADNLYANFDVESPTFFTEGNQAWKLPSYSLVDAGASYNFKVMDFDITARVNVNNVLNTTYISEAATNFLPGTDGIIPDNNRVFFGFGRTWNTSLKVRF